MFKNVLALIDNRVGNNNQTRFIANLISNDITEMFLEYNFFVKFPNFILSKMNIAQYNRNITPQIVISTGRRASSVALKLKRETGCKIIQILKPCSSYDKFDLVILPNHDKKHNKTYSDNVIFTYGGLNFIDTVKYSQASLLKSSKQIVCVLIGGPSNSCKFSKKTLIKLLNQLNSLDFKYYISLSRRSPEYFRNIIEEVMPKAQIYSPKDSVPNPYYSFLKSADFIVVTGDSISMMSESASLAKPVYIYSEVASEKHLKCAQNLVNIGAAKFFESELEYYSQIPYSASWLKEVIINRLK